MVTKAPIAAANPTMPRLPDWIERSTRHSRLIAMIDRLLHGSIGKSGDLHVTPGHLKLTRRTPQWHNANNLLSGSMATGF
jgi:hypothetical protein